VWGRFRRAGKALYKNLRFFSVMARWHA